MKYESARRTLEIAKEALEKYQKYSKENLGIVSNPILKRNKRLTLLFKQVENAFKGHLIQNRAGIVNCSVARKGYEFYLVPNKAKSIIKKDYSLFPAIVKDFIAEDIEAAYIDSKQNQLKSLLKENTESKGLCFLDYLEENNLVYGSKVGIKEGSCILDLQPINDNELSVAIAVNATKELEKKIENEPEVVDKLTQVKEEAAYISWQIDEERA